MNGSVEHMSLREVQRDTNSDQSRLSSFGTSGTTYIGIVNQTNDAFDDAVDEHAPELAPPDDLFFHWLHEKKTNRMDEDMQPVTAHNRAIEEVGYEARYRQYLEQDDDARAALGSLADRVADGEHIVLVCFCSDGKWCHRELATEILKDLLDV